MNNIDSNDRIEPDESDRQPQDHLTERTLNSTEEFFLAFFTRLARWKYALIATIMVPTVIAALINLVLPKKYDSVAIILPVQESSRSFS